jgi:hypothetical protein
MLVRIDIVFFRPQNRTPYIMIVEAPPSEMAWMPAYLYEHNLYLV